MNLIDFLERRFSRFAITGLIRYVVVLNAVAYILTKYNQFFYSILELDPYLVREGQVWRLVTFIFIPRVDGLISLMLGPVLGPPIVTALALWGLWFMGEGLEQAWGAFRLNLYYFIGMTGVIIAAFFFGGGVSNLVLNLSLFFAFARYYPEVIFYIMYVLPCKAKWLAWMGAAFVVYQFIFRGPEIQAATFACFANYLLFFGPEMIQDARLRGKVSERRKRFEATKKTDDPALHRCSVCSRTDASDPDLEFRVGQDGNDYCVNHLPKRTVPAS